MVIDTSAVMAILNDEPERRSFNEAIEKAESCLMSAASLNFVDCFSYALAKATVFPLLFKENDFSQTDVERVT